MEFTTETLERGMEEEEEEEQQQQQKWKQKEREGGRGSDRSLRGQ